MRFYRFLGKHLIVASNEDNCHTHRKYHGRQSHISHITREIYLENMGNFSEGFAITRLCKCTCIVINVGMSHDIFMFFIPSPMLSLFLAFNPQPLDQKPIISDIPCNHTESLSTFDQHKSDHRPPIVREIHLLVHVVP